jgi:hypothetical protein
MRKSNRHRIFLWTVFISFVMLCLPLTLTLFIMNPTTQSSWFGTNDFQVEIGPRSGPRSPGPQGQYIEGEDSRLDRRIKSSAIAFYGTDQDSRRDYWIRGDWFAGQCTYDGIPLLALGDFEVRVWKCSP